MADSAIPTPPTPQQLAGWFPRKRTTPPETFEIGLVLAGAVSAGSYTAGVLDYLFEALDAWHEARRVDPSLPRHDVMIRIITGASAGGMNGAIAAAALHRTYPHIHAGLPHSDPQWAGNPFYNAWVRAVDIEPMLADLRDLDHGVPSFLNCDVLEQIVSTTLSPPATAPRLDHDWVINPLPLILTVTNLRGVPYSVAFHSASGTSQHGMTMHRDYMQFAAEGLSLRQYDPPPPGFVVLPEDTAKAEWKQLGAAALATGAFPFGLRSRVIDRPLGDYDWRNPYFDAAGTVGFGPPAWPVPKADPYAFLSIDGGTMNNEPFDLTHDVLAGVEGTNPREGDQAVRAIIMVDPFVDPPEQGPDKTGTMLEMGKALLTAYQHQARYSAGDWALIQADAVYSRFLVAPSRSDDVAAEAAGLVHIQNNGVDGADALASGGLGAFLGFFSEHYRHHDFMLGRRNCQWFLKTVFTLPAGNPLFDNWSANARRTFADARDPTHLQIIPVVSAVNGEERLPEWPARKFSVHDALTTNISRRFDAVVFGLEREALAEVIPWKRVVARVFLWPLKLMAKGYVFGIIMDRIRAAVTSIDTRP
jgi:hypothetical protein